MPPSAVIKLLGLGALVGSALAQPQPATNYNSNGYYSSSSSDNQYSSSYVKEEKKKFSQFPSSTKTRMSTRSSTLTSSLSPSPTLSMIPSGTASSTFILPPPPIIASPSSTPPISSSNTPAATETRTMFPSATSSFTAEVTPSNTPVPTASRTMFPSATSSFTFIPIPPPIEVSASSTLPPTASTTPAPPSIVCPALPPKPRILITWYELPACQFSDLPGQHRTFVSVPADLCQANPTGQGSFGGYRVQCNADGTGVFQTCTTNTCDQCTGGFFFQSNTCIATNGAFGSWSVSVDCNSDNSPPERALPPPGNFAITWYECPDCVAAQHYSVVIGPQGICNVAPGSPPGGYLVNCNPDGQSGVYQVCRDAKCAVCDVAYVPFRNDQCLPNGPQQVTGAASVNFRCAVPAAFPPPPQVAPISFVQVPVAVPIRVDVKVEEKQKPINNNNYGHHGGGDNRWGQP